MDPVVDIVFRIGLILVMLDESALFVRSTFEI